MGVLDNVTNSLETSLGSVVPAEFLGTVVLAILAVGLFTIGTALLLEIVMNWKFYKNGGCHGWAFIIPIYNMYCFFKILFRSGWYFLLLLIPIVNIVLLLIIPFRLARVYDKGFWFGVATLLFPGVLFPVYALGGLDYCGPNS